MGDLASLRSKGSWTVLVYIAADNELAASAETSLKSIAAGGSSSSIFTAVQIDRKGKGGATRYVGRDGVFREEQQVGQVDTGDPGPLIEFLKWGISQCPAEHYLWVLWGHGAGLDHRTQGFTPGADVRQCLGDGLSNDHYADVDSDWNTLFNDGILEILHDYATMHYLSNECLRFALNEVRTATGCAADILGLDACLMGMAEIVCDFSDSALFTVTSEDTEPRSSWPYKQIVRQLVANPTIEPQGLGTLIVKNYMASFPAIERRRGLTLSLCDLSKTPVLIEAVRDLSDTLVDYLSAGGRTAIGNARDSAPRYDRDYVDIEVFCQSLANACENMAVVESCRRVIAAIQSDFVVYTESEGRQVSHSDGLSIFFPNREKARKGTKSRSGSNNKRPRTGSRIAKLPTAVVLVRTSYKTLTFVRATHWDRFLLEYLDQDGSPSDQNLHQGEKMNFEDASVDTNEPEPSVSQTKPSGPRKKPSGPRKKPSGPRKKPSGPRKKPSGPRKKPSGPRKKPSGPGKRAKH